MDGTMQASDGGSTTKMSYRRIFKKRVKIFE